jgi:hypothetical protein
MTNASNILEMVEKIAPGAAFDLSIAQCCLTEDTPSDNFSFKALWDALASARITKTQTLSQGGLLGGHARLAHVHTLLPPL